MKVITILPSQDTTLLSYLEALTGKSQSSEKSKDESIISGDNDQSSLEINSNQSNQDDTSTEADIQTTNTNDTVQFKMIQEL